MNPADRPHDPGPIPANETGLIDWGLHDPDPDPADTAELLLRLAADADRVLRRTQAEIEL